jgi:hypothetical protein
MIWISGTKVIRSLFDGLQDVETVSGLTNVNNEYDVYVTWKIAIGSINFGVGKNMTPVVRLKFWFFVVV